MIIEIVPRFCASGNKQTFENYSGTRSNKRITHTTNYSQSFYG